jgi:hypothetical protein
VRSGNVPNSACYWQCVDCGTTFLQLIAALIPLPLQEQAERPLCLSCYRRRLDLALAELSEQQVNRRDGAELL